MELFRTVEEIKSVRVTDQFSNFLANAENSDKYL